ncbi:MAG: peptidylprolyl isomerase [Rhodospirillaceae bacterium]
MTILVNDVEIREEAVAREVQLHPAASLAEARLAAARALVVRELLLQEAHRLALVPDDDEEPEDIDGALIDTLLDRAVTVPEPDETRCRQHYEQNSEHYGSSVLYEAAHILFPAASNDRDRRHEAEQAARKTLVTLQAEPRRFAELARTHSACPTGAEGGGLGQFTAGEMVPELIAALDAIEPGSLHPEPVSTRFGFHVVRLDHRDPGQVLPFDQVRDRISVELYDRAWRLAVHRFIGELAGRARISGVEMATTQ